MFCGDLYTLRTRFRLFNVEIIERMGPSIGYQETFLLPPLPLFRSVLLDRSIDNYPDYDRHREPITRTVLFISIIHGGFAPFNAPPPLFSQLPRAAAATEPHLEPPGFT